MEEKIRAVVESEGFVEKMIACEEPEQVQALFAENGIELTIDDVMAIGKSLDLALSDSDELNEDDLDAVAGGIAGTIVAVAVSVIGVVVKNWRSIKNWFRRW